MTTSASGPVQQARDLPTVKPTQAYDETPSANRQWTRDGGPGSKEQATLRQVGERIRSLRQDQQRTLKSVAEESGVSASMLSLLERGRASPSLGTLVSICSVFGIQMSDLFDVTDEVDRDTVIRRQDHRELRMANGVSHQIIRADHKRNIELLVTRFDPGAASDSKPRHHAGYEYGLLLEGELQVELDRELFVLRSGDSISYESMAPHRIVNDGPQAAVAVWVNLHG